MKKKIYIFSIILIIFILFVSYLFWNSNKSLTLSEILPADFEAYRTGTFVSEDTEPLKLTEEQIKEIMELLDSLEYQAQGKTDSLSDAYARLLVGVDAETCEILISSDFVLIHELNTDKESQLYKINGTSDSVRNYFENL